MDEQAVAPDVEDASETLVAFDTVRFGEVSVPESRVMDFPRGLVGMPSARRFVFLHREETEGPFFWMQSADDPRLAFVVCEPQRFFPDYSVPLTIEDQELLGIHTVEDGMACVILVVPSDPRQITANLRGPIAINPEKRCGIQLVLAGEEFPVRARLFATQEEAEMRCSS